MLTVPSTQSEGASSNLIGNRQKLCELLAMDLGFHDECSSHNSHDFHAFPAKFPPQLPKLFIDHSQKIFCKRHFNCSSTFGRATGNFRFTARSRNSISIDT